VSKVLGWRLPKVEPRDLALILLVAAAVIFAYYKMFGFVVSQWFEEGGYYQHGLFAPLLAAWMIVKMRARLTEIGISPARWGIWIVLAGFLIMWQGVHVNSQVIREFAFMVFVVGACVYAFGPKITKALTMPLILLTFMLPMPDLLFSEMTNSAQVYSTKVAVKILDVLGYDPMMRDNSIITMDNYTLYVGAPCSGFKLTMALLMFAVFFSSIARFNWWRIVVMFAVLIPVAIIVNSWRIAMIGVFGENFGDNAARLFHDRGSYLELLLAYGALFLLARWLGWKD
jgi:exosortase